MNRRGFTLLELIVSIAIAGVIALLVYGSANAGLDTRDALDRYRAGAEAELRARLMLADALRHATDEVDDRSAFELVDATDSQGAPADQLTFVTRGIVPPLGASPLWSVTVASTPAGLLVRASPVPDASRDSHSAAISTVLRDVRGVDVHVASLADASWTTTWPSAAQLPSAVRLVLFDRAGVPAGVPLVVRVGLESLR